LAAFSAYNNFNNQIWDESASVTWPGGRNARTIILKTKCGMKDIDAPVENPEIEYNNFNNQIWDESYRIPVFEDTAQVQ